MRLYRDLLVVLAITLVAAMVAVLVRADPGYLLLRAHGYVVETSLVFAILGLLASAVLLWALIALLRWPWTAYQRRARRRARLRLARASLALIEGRYERSASLYTAARKAQSTSTVAMIGLAMAERRRGADRAAGAVLADLGTAPEADLAAVILRAEHEMATGQAGTVIEVLTPLDHAHRLPPAGLELLIDALIARGRAREAWSLWPRLARAGAQRKDALDARAATIAAAALRQASDAINLESMWRELDAPRRKALAVATAYAERALQLGASATAAATLGKLIDDDPRDAALAALWLGLPADDDRERIAAAEAWVARCPQDGALQLAAGELCRRAKAYAKAEPVLHRALSSDAAVLAWEALGALYADMGDAQRATRAYANAVAVRRGQPASPITARLGAQELTEPAVVGEERDEFGVPRIAGALTVQR